MYEYDLVDILKWFKDSHNKQTVAVVYPDGSGGIYFDNPGFPYGGGELDPYEPLLEFDSLDDMVNRFDYLLEEGDKMLCPSCELAFSRSDESERITFFYHGVCWRCWKEIRLGCICENCYSSHHKSDRCPHIEKEV